MKLQVEVGSLADVLCRKYQEEIEDTKVVIRVPKSKDRQRNDKMKKGKRTNNDLQNTTQKTKDRVTRTPLQTGGRISITQLNG